MTKILAFFYTAEIFSKASFLFLLEEGFPKVSSWLQNISPEIPVNITHADQLTPSMTAQCSASPNETRWRPENTSAFV